MIKNCIIYISIIFFICCTPACNREELPLDRETFTRMLVEMHLTDAVLNEYKKNTSGWSDKKRYSYYTELYSRYGVTRAEFDSCINYYSRETTLFESIYEDVTDSLNKRLTAVKRVVAELHKNDSVNFLTIPDTIHIDGWYKDTVISLSGIGAGKYSFKLSFKYDSIPDIKQNKVQAYFLRHYNKDTVYYVDSTWYKPYFMRVDSVLNQAGCKISEDSLYTFEKRRDSFAVQEKRVRIDTFAIRPINLAVDTNLHDFSWSYYVDSSFDTFVMRFVVSDYNEGDTVKPQYGIATKIGLFKTYLSSRAEREQQVDFTRRSNSLLKFGDSIYTLGKNAVLVHDTLNEKDCVELPAQ